jgi:arginine decarboxylase
VRSRVETRFTMGGSAIDDQAGGEPGETPYLDALVSYRDRSPHCFNVPSHKAGRFAPPKLVEAVGPLALGLDIPPLIPGIDSGPDPTPLERSQRLAAEAWGASRTWFIDHGGSGAVHAALLAARQLGSKVLIQRNVHSSAISGLILAGLDPIFVHPEVDDDLGVAHCVSSQSLTRELAAHPDVAVVFLLSPTYYGTSANVRELIGEVHAAGKAVILDEAWGAHFSFSTLLPDAAIGLGADLVISSTHKMAGSLTQSAMLHLGREPRGFDERVVDRAVTALESTSPSALLEGSLDAARAWMATRGEEAIARTHRAVPELHGQIRELGLEVLDRACIGHHAISDIDLLRVCIDTRPLGIDGRRLGDALQARGVFPELVGHNTVVAILSPGEDKDHMQVLVDGLRDSVRDATPHASDGSPRLPLPSPGQTVMTPREAWLGPADRVKLREAVGRVSTDTLAVYPPGIPNVLPGEVITTQIVDFIEDSLTAGAFVRGNPDRTLSTVNVVAGA